MLSDVHRAGQGGTVVPSLASLLCVAGLGRVITDTLSPLHHSEQPRPGQQNTGGARARHNRLLVLSEYLPLIHHTALSASQQQYIPM